jgi:hypothetical protein
MLDLTIQDKNAISEFKEFLLKQSDEFSQKYYEFGKSCIYFKLTREVLHLHDYFGYVIFNDFKSSLWNKFLYDDLEKLTVDIQGIHHSEIYIYIAK